MKRDILVVGNHFSDQLYTCINNKFQKFYEDGGYLRLIDVFDRNYFEFHQDIYSEYKAIFCINDFGEGSQVKLIKKNYRYFSGSGWQQNRTSTFAGKRMHLTHFMYVNTLFDLDVDKYDTNIKSCDIATHVRKDIPKQQIIDNISKCDYVFMSDESPIKYEDIENKNKKKQYIIQHNKYGSNIYNNSKGISSIVRPPVNFKLTVGAGDIFAANFMIKVIEGFPILECQNYAHTKTFEYLEKINEKI